MRGNGAVVDDNHIIATYATEMEAFDSLPRAVRDVLNDASFKFNAGWLLGMYRNGRSEQWLVDGLKKQEAKLKCES